MFRILENIKDPFGHFGNMTEKPDLSKSDDPFERQCQRDYEMALKFAVASILGVIASVLLLIIAAMIKELFF